MAPSGEDPSGSPSRRARLLVIDDDPLVLNAIRRVLERDHDVEVAQGGQVALAILAVRETTDFDVIFCDLSMPGLSGAELYRQLSVTKPGVAARMVFLTGGAVSEGDIGFLAEAGRVKLPKPFAVETLRAFVRARVP